MSTLARALRRTAQALRLAADIIDPPTYAWQPLQTATQHLHITKRAPRIF